MQNVAILNTCIGGSTGKIAVGLFNYLLERGINSWFCYGREDGTVKNNYYRTGGKIATYTHVAVARILGIQGYGSVFSTVKMIAHLKKCDIDTVFIVSLHGYYLNEPLLYSYVYKNSIDVIYIMVDEYAFLGKCGYGTGCSNYLSGCRKCPKLRKYPKSFFINGAPVIYNMKSRWYKKIKNMTFVGPAYTVAQAKKSPLLKNKKTVILDEAVNTSFYTPKNNSLLKHELNISDNKIVIVCVAPYSLERKGCKYFVELAKKLENDSRYIFVHVGFDVPVESVKLPSNYIAVGFLKDQEKLAQYYSMGDLFVFPSVSDTMPNACLEALSAGTPLLCFNISGMPFIADKTVATFVEAKNVDQMAEVIRNTSGKTKEQIASCREYALRRYDNQKYYERLCEIAEKAI